MAEPPVPTAAEILAAIARDLELGVQETIADGVTVRLSDPRARMDAFQQMTEVEESIINVPTRFPFGMKMIKLIPPGGG